MPDSDGVKIPYRYMGNEISLTNQVNSLVALAKIQTGEDTLQGTGLTYGDDLTYDVSGTAPEGAASIPAGTPAQPNTVKYAPSNPYEGMPQ